VIAFGFILFSVYGTLIFLFILIRSSLLWVLEGEKFFSKFPEDILSESRYQDYLKQNPPAHKSPTPNLGEKQ
jgi:TM2 domain-containing membrane protein YozV